MGGVWSYFSSFFYASRHTKLLMTGLDAAGKTSILYLLKLGTTEITTIPTIGFNVETFTFKNVSMTVWDTAGGRHSPSRIRMLSHYTSDTDGIIFVLDSADRDRLNEAKEMIHNLYSGEKLTCPLLVWANKQDLPTAMTVSEIADELEIEKIEGLKSYSIQPCSYKLSVGFTEGLEWISEHLGPPDR